MESVTSANGRFVTIYENSVLETVLAALAATFQLNSGYTHTLKIFCLFVCFLKFSSAQLTEAVKCWRFQTFATFQRSQVGENSKLLN